MESMFKKGDRVFHIQLGWGYVYEVSSRYLYGLTVCFKDDIFKKFTHDGKYLVEDSIPTLSFTEYKLDGFSQKRPKDLPESGELVLVRDRENQAFTLRVFDFFKDDKFYCHTQGESDPNEVYSWNYCKRFKFID